MIGALIGATALSAGAGLANTAVNAYEASEDRKFNAKESQKNRDFQERMSNTQYQRAVADMEAAGINPASLGGMSDSAGNLTGSAGYSTARNVGQFSDNFGSLFSSAIQYTLQKDKFARDEVFKNFEKFSNKALNSYSSAQSKVYKSNPFEEL